MGTSNYYIGSDEADDEEIIIPDIPTTILGYRQWKFDPAQNLLMTRVPWPRDDLLYAECLSYTEAALSSASTSPFYGFMGTPQRLSQDEEHVSPSSPDEEVIIQEVRWDEKGCRWIRKNNTESIVTHPNPGCGIYSFNTFRNLRLRPFYTFNMRNVVTGIIEMGGRVWPHEKGYRAQYALVKAIYVVNDYDAEIAALYGAEAIEPPSEEDHEWLMNKYNNERLDKKKEQREQDENENENG